ncbi:hypothetical protein GCM10027052_06930 [Parafrigoribacterium mesophilum]
MASTSFTGRHRILVGISLSALAFAEQLLVFEFRCYYHGPIERHLRAPQVEGGRHHEKGTVRIRGAVQGVARLLQ